VEKEEEKETYRERNAKNIRGKVRKRERGGGGREVYKEKNAE
jgi:hypothetical protein